MKIRDITIQKNNKITRISGFIDDIEVWFECKSKQKLFANPDVFVIAALIPAMLKKQDINLDTEYRISRQLLSNLEHIQEILSLWYPQLSKIKIIAEVNERKIQIQSGVASFFSGGVDGSYTFLAHMQEITHLVLVEGMDIQLDNTELQKQVVQINSEYAKIKHKELVLIRSNIRQYITNFGLSFVIGNAAALASVSHALMFSKMYIAGSHSILGLFPWGSHPMLDPWFSNEYVEIIHDAATVKRTEKVRRISEDPDTLKILRVCWQDAGYNCGKCEKCLRTMLTLRLLGVESNTFPKVDLMKSLKSIRLYSKAQHLFFQENLELAIESNDQEAIKALKKIDKQHKARAALVTLDQVWFKGYIKRLFNSF